ncbi:MAG: acetate/propionate family kinase [Alphaproteobacteria bacterium]|nr:acetate/propionate family kinase [Alphaproteobacteria bacterium]
MSVVVINCGSTSLKAERIDPVSGERFASVHVERIGEEVPDHGAALAASLDRLLDGSVEVVGHRVVHGGDRFTAPVRIDPDVVRALEALVPLAPLHNPANIAGIRAALEALPDVPHVAVFDTAVHATLPRRAHTYALPFDRARAQGIRRYGFHGPSHAWVAERAAEWMQADVRDLRLITCHLGGGCSVTAWENGASVETSMGLTPLEGLVMASRSGDVDPGALIAFARAEGLDLDGLDHVLNHESGLQGLAGSRDLRDLEARAAEGDDAARLAIGVFAHRVRKYIGAYAAVLGGVDAIVMTGGIGENAVAMRQRIAQRFEYLGLALDPERNADARLSDASPVAELSTERSRTKLLAVKTDENRSIAMAALKIARGGADIAALPPIPVKVSARHVHLSPDHVEALFGPGYTLTPRAPLGQPGQFVCGERVTIVGPKSRIERVGIIGPPRGASQVEISRTDEFALGVDAPVRLSGDHRNTPGITIVGPKGEVVLTSGLICAWRHIHMTPADAEQYGVQHGDHVEVELDTDGRDLVFRDVMVRVKDSYALEMHIDTDEANAAELGRNATGMLVPTGANVRVTRRDTRHDRVDP